MDLNISEAEQKAMQDYFDHPEKYMDAEDSARYQNNHWPNGTKISRPKIFVTENHEPWDYRYYIIPINNDGEICRIPIKTPHHDDPCAHSATLQKDKLYFHQNKTDLPKILPDYFDLTEINEALEEEKTMSEEDKEAFRQKYLDAYKRPNYKLRSTIHGLFSKTIKYAVDAEAHLYYLKSHTAFYSSETIIPPSNDVEMHAPALYMGPSLFRVSPLGYTTQTKRVDITRDAGETLHEFMQNRKHTLSNVQIETLAIEILKQYLIQIDLKNLIHTDIKSLNICVQETGSTEKPFIVKFIDFEEAFDENNPCTAGHGTPDYMAPEFFKTQEDYENQYENREISERTYFNTLLPDYQEQFSKASDIYALGAVLLDDLPLQEGSNLEIFAQNMCASDWKDRPSGTEIGLEIGLNRLTSPPEELNSPTVRRHSF